MDESYRYNLNPNASSSLGFKHTKESKALIAEGRKGKTHSAESIVKMSEAKRGVNNPMFGKDLSGTNHPMYGKTHSADTIAKMRGKTVSEQTKALIAEARKGKLILLKLLQK